MDESLSLYIKRLQTPSVPKHIPESAFSRGITTVMHHRGVWGGLGVRGVAAWLRRRGHRHLQQAVVLALAGRAVAVLRRSLHKFDAHLVLLELHKEPAGGKHSGPIG